jgi:GT2 family glycosyltransferase
MKAAILVTCFNRVQITIDGLSSLLRGVPTWVDLRVFAVDDGSTDGTGEALRAMDPRVQVIEGTGDLYWGGGMRLAEEHALQWSPDWIVWINDDVEFRAGAITSAFEQMREGSGEPTCWVGQIVDERDKSTVIYGGRKRRVSRRGAALDLVRDHRQSIDTFNGNFVAVSSDSHARVGPISSQFTHLFGDYDYGLRLSISGVALRILPHPVGEASPNPNKDRMFRASVRLRDRVKIVLSPTGLPPREYWQFQKTYAPNYSRFAFFRTYARVLLPRRGE